MTYDHLQEKVPKEVLGRGSPKNTTKMGQCGKSSQKRWSNLRTFPKYQYCKYTRQCAVTTGTFYPVNVGMGLLVVEIYLLRNTAIITLTTLGRQVSLLQHYLHVFSFGQTTRAWNDDYPKVPEDFTITDMAPTRAFSWLKVPTIAVTFKTLLRHY